MRFVKHFEPQLERVPVVEREPALVMHPRSLTGIGKKVSHLHVVARVFAVDPDAVVEEVIAVASVVDAADVDFVTDALGDQRKNADEGGGDWMHGLLKEICGHGYFRVS